MKYLVFERLALFSLTMLIIAPLSCTPGRDSYSEVEIDSSLELLQISEKYLDGSMVRVYDSTIVELININSKSAISWLSEHRNTCDNLIIRLENTVFTDYVAEGDSFQRLEAKHRRTIQSLRAYKPRDLQENRVKNELLSAIEDLSLRQVD